MTNKKCALARTIYSYGSSEYHHQDGCVNTATSVQHKCLWAPKNQTKDIEDRCLVHDPNVQQEAPCLQKLGDNYGDASTATLLLSKKLDILIQVCEANADETKNVPAQVQAIAAKPDVNTTEVQTAVDKTFNALQNPCVSIKTDISAASANDIPLKKVLAAAKLHALSISNGVNKLQSEIEKHKGAIRIFFKDSSFIQRSLSLAVKSLKACCRLFGVILNVIWRMLSRELRRIWSRLLRREL